MTAPRRDRKGPTTPPPPKDRAAPRPGRPAPPLPRPQLPLNRRSVPRSGRR